MDANRSEAETDGVNKREWEKNGKRSGGLKLELWWQLFGMEGVSKADYVVLRESWEKARDSQQA